MAVVLAAPVPPAQQVVTEILVVLVRVDAENVTQVAAVAQVAQAGSVEISH
jgi:hypothetical protein